VFEIHVLTKNEDSVVISHVDLVEIDKMIRILGEKFSEVVSITVVMVDVYGTQLAVLHKQTFTV
jgi:hypothetical protein